MATERKDVWASGDAYEPYVGRWSRLVGRQFVRWLGVRPNKEWLDVGSGTGALCEVILAVAAPGHISLKRSTQNLFSYPLKRSADYPIFWSKADIPSCTAHVRFWG
jgi:ubiquinone/menaquinone biosynthesis C-methylase UbiE